MMLPPKERMCHCTGFEKSCRALVTDEACNRWHHVQGVHPQTGESISRWDCADNLSTLLLLDLGKLMAEAGAATESFRNAVVGARSSAPAPRVVSTQAIEHKEAAE